MSSWAAQALTATEWKFKSRWDKPNCHKHKWELEGLCCELLMPENTDVGEKKEMKKMREMYHKIVWFVVSVAVVSL